jgi:ABC-type antimicrobial peptide transport system permease subunit
MDRQRGTIMIEALIYSVLGGIVGFSLSYLFMKLLDSKWGKIK